MRKYEGMTVLIFSLIKEQLGKGYWCHTQERWECEW